MCGGGTVNGTQLRQLFQVFENQSARAHEQCDAVCEIEASKFHCHVHLEMLKQENLDGFWNGKQCAKIVWKPRACCEERSSACDRRNNEAGIVFFGARRILTWDVWHGAYRASAPLVHGRDFERDD